MCVQLVKRCEAQAGGAVSSVRIKLKLVHWHCTIADSSSTSTYPLRLKSQALHLKEFEEDPNVNIVSSHCHFSTAREERSKLQVSSFTLKSRLDPTVTGIRAIFGPRHRHIRRRVEGVIYCCSI
jgi:hypothetical protein